MWREKEVNEIVEHLKDFHTPLSILRLWAADKLEGPLKGKPLSELAVAGANGSLYINIHTEQYPNGEIRGQIVNPAD